MLAYIIIVKLCIKSISIILDRSRIQQRISLTCSNVTAKLNRTVTKSNLSLILVQMKFFHSVVG